MKKGWNNLKDSLKVDLRNSTEEQYGRSTLKNKLIHRASERAQPAAKLDDFISSLTNGTVKSDVP